MGGDGQALVRRRLRSFRCDEKKVSSKHSDG
jgi:hypothetical protein